MVGKPRQGKSTENKLHVFLWLQKGPKENSLSLAIDWIFLLTSIPISYFEILTLKVMKFWGKAFGRQWDHEGITLINGACALIKEAQETSLAPSAMWVYSEKTHLYGSVSPDTESVGALILDFPTSRAVRNTYLLFKATQTAVDFPGGSSGKEPACQCRRHKRWGFDPWVRKIPWRR